MTRSGRWPAAVAAALVAVAMTASCADGTSGGAVTRPSVQQDAPQLVGSRWLLTEIVSGGADRTVPEAMGATWQFTADEQFLASDTVNAISGKYRLLPTGFRTIDAATTLVGYVGSDPVRLAVMAGFQKMTVGPVVVDIGSASDQVVMRVAGFAMTFRRAGPAQTFPPPSATSTASTASTASR